MLRYFYNTMRNLINHLKKDSIRRTKKNLFTTSCPSTYHKIYLYRKKIFSYRRWNSLSNSKKLHYECLSYPQALTENYEPGIKYPSWKMVGKARKQWLRKVFGLHKEIYRSPYGLQDLIFLTLKF